MDIFSPEYAGEYPLRMWWEGEDDGMVLKGMGGWKGEHTRNVESTKKKKKARPLPPSVSSVLVPPANFLI